MYIDHCIERNYSYQLFVVYCFALENRLNLNLPLLMLLVMYDKILVYCNV